MRQRSTGEFFKLPGLRAAQDNMRCGFEERYAPNAESQSTSCAQERTVTGRVTIGVVARHLSAPPGP
jgi:hypothetical protein